MLRHSDSLVRIVENPFELESPWTRYEVFKAGIVGITLFPLRISVLLVTLSLQLLVAKIATIGFPLQEDRGCLYHRDPLSCWRSTLLVPIMFTNRLLLWCLGFWHIRIIDRRTDKSIRPNLLVCAPHQSFVDPFVLGYAFPPLPGAVGKKELLKISLVKPLYVAGQGIFVDRKNADSRHACKEAIAMRANPENWSGPPTMIFPEGTTTNGRILVQFKAGPFLPGRPVQPVLLRYPCKHFPVNWVGANSNLLKLMLRMMLQFANFCEVEVLEPYLPSAAECADAMLFAGNVRQSMAKRLGIGTTEHTYDDVFLSGIAQQFGVQMNFECNELKNRYEMNFDDLKAIISDFHRLDKNKDGELSSSEFEQVMMAGTGFTKEAVQSLFRFFDTDHSGSVQYREFVQVAALLSDKCTSESRAKLAFLLYDDRGTGRVRRDTLLKSLNSAMAHPDGMSSTASPGAKLLANTAPEELNYDEFCNLVKQQPEVLENAFTALRERLGLS